ncbi:helix-turn-helix domain-containing protein [Paraburkholderia phenazinium]|uniref:AraC-type DNA-binding protein n=1 Tax=Paraburkholderia phenazinium TaxID=60549 RepID=A0A1G8KCP4_9BURK|nr:AraC family transcriptional regulator [Paraburkholderia phenazinium]SDI41226.1 AraC-type DNA-binding protein [Paraburkholderia phenazinium]
MTPRPATAQPLKSYHLLHAAVTGAAEADADAAVLARSVRSVVAGFVEHAVYAQAAQAAARTLGAGQRARRLQQGFTCDANPLAALLFGAGENAEFDRRWNALNRLARLGVRTHLEESPHASAPSLRRQPQAAAADSAFRSELVEQCIEAARSCAQQRPANADRPDRLFGLAQALALPGSAAADAIGMLYEEPATELLDAAAQLGCAPRTLQRDLGRHGLTFGLVKQAVRLTIAGYRLRNLDESITATAQAAGFFDSAHLNHAWEAACDIAPSVYRTLAGRR